MKKELVFDIDYTELEDLIFKHYGVEYEIIPECEVGSSQYSAYMLYDLHELEQEDKFAILGSLPERGLHEYIEHLQAKGVLESGKYFISISW